MFHCSNKKAKTLASWCRVSCPKYSYQYFSPGPMTDSSDAQRCSSLQSVFSNKQLPTYGFKFGLSLLLNTFYQNLLEERYNPGQYMAAEMN